MTPTTAGIGILLAAVTVESFAQMFLKFGATDGAKTPWLSHRGSVGNLLVGLPPKGWVGLGLAAYVVEILLYTVALHFLDVSIAFPLGSLCFVGVAVLSRIFLGESVGRVRWLGVACILAGAILVAM